jgi:hypothetical protein
MHGVAQQGDCNRVLLNELAVGFDRIGADSQNDGGVFFKLALEL